MVLFIELISCPYLIHPLVLDNTGIIMNIEHNTKYPSNPISGHTPTDQCVKRKRRLMGSACKWMDHPPPPRGLLLSDWLGPSPQFITALVKHCLYTILAKCPRNGKKSK